MEGLTVVVTAKDGETTVASADGKDDLPFALAIAKPKLWSPTSRSSTICTSN